jgi:HSP20 family protein
MSGPTDPFDEMERFFDQFTRLGTAASGDVPVDVLDDGESFVVVADLPGYGTDSIDVQLQGGRQLELSATRDTDRGTDGGGYVRRERSAGRVSRTVTLPEPADEESAEASYDNGVLTVRLGKQAATGQGTDIPVN